AMSVLNVVLMWIGIVEVWRMHRSGEAGYPRKSIYSMIITILLFTASSFLGLPTKIHPYFINSSIFIGLAFLLAIMVILLDEKVQNAFLKEIPLLHIFKSRTSMSVYRDSVGSSSSTNLSASSAYMEIVEHQSTSPRRVSESTYLLKTAPVERIQLQEAVVKKAPADLDYEMYENWINSLSFPRSKISYEEFSKIRRIVNSVMKKEVFGMRRDKLDVKSLSLLAKIDRREDVEKIKKFADGEYFKKLRRFELVSENGRLMAKGVRLVKELKKEGLIEKLREQIYL
ncbi:MAG: hypothetical protein QXF02_06330, partial [Candidatus Korarchaeota archaeon]